MQFLRDLPDGLPSAAYPFYERLTNVVSSAQGAIEKSGPSALSREEVTLDRVVKLFDFSTFPGLKEFLSLAQAAPSECADFS